MNIQNEIWRYILDFVRTKNSDPVGDITSDYVWGYIWGGTISPIDDAITDAIWSDSGYNFEIKNLI